MVCYIIFFAKFGINYFLFLLLNLIQFNSLFPKAMRFMGEYINIFTVHDIGGGTVYVLCQN